MGRPFTINDILSSKAAGINQHLHPVKKEKSKGSKYNNEKPVIDGIQFDSKKEGKRYGQLKMKRRAGLIGLLRMQVYYELNPGGEFSLKYKADFVYWDLEKDCEVVEDCKGLQTPEYKKKKKLMLKIHGIKIFET